ncbi:protein-L-isoaspartate(D-aspartate) O-methyltransferase [Prosthecochloris sp. HL-130-GSB]|jgi:protein-L-isoaspartate(D-aspartate) O-methyltransferase|uniref:protein-L-isoaspartate(D-aspartate) O-methyltransferase n=1 Tax=Prosthecochloris sp. HL-130-GSB TaxID=1974213 RepID=UPI000A1C154F|nr:protein-L-isoaspartate(D-aspartate) O-methyltransferase [Prosthecochloris sp. HL-130-GSB]ARM30245.1 protein-L-isoaspartate O-methyltransferase [Prosthecochloris sp. HL-130-GSB]MBO8091853.1 protein-L-isoaspartate(D-aspartate) O-methyltransferase [Prosthecochloris sp.]
MSFREATYRERRHAMVRQLVRYGMTDERVLRAFETVPRHLFFPEHSRELAYEDAAFPIGFGQTISQPFTVAYMTSLLHQCSPAGRVLEIGTGSGYQAAVLDALGYDVYTIERIGELYRHAAGVFHQLGLDIHSRQGDGSLGWPEKSPFDGIIVTAAAPDVPETLAGQLALDGCMVIPVGGIEGQRMTVVKRSPEGFERKLYESFAFVPLIGREGWQDDDSR